MKNPCAQVKGLLLLTCFGAVSTALAQQELPDIIEKISPSVVVVVAYDDTGRRLDRGSGFFVHENGTVVTNHHVIEAGSRFEIKTSDGKMHPVSAVLSVDPDGDLALLLTDTPRSSVHVLEVSSILPRKGERVIVIGCPLGLEQTVSDGIVSAVRELPLFGSMIQLTAPMSHGSSGGPVVDMNGKVIGVAKGSAVDVANGSADSGENLNFAIPGERVAKLLSRTVAATPGEPNQPAHFEVGSPEDLFKQGLVFLWAEKHEEALTKFEHAVAKKSVYPEAYFYIGYCNHSLGHYDEAIQAYEKAIQLRPDMAAAWNNKGEPLHKLGRDEEALQACEKAIQLKPDYADAWNNRGLALDELGRHDEALQTLEKAIQLKPDYADAWNNKGMVLGKLGRYDEALQACGKAIQLRPNYALAWYNKGGILGSLGRYSEALEAYEKAIQLEPNDADTWYNKGWALHKLGRDIDALKAYEKTSQLKPDFVRAWYNRACIHSKLGQKRAALAALKEAIRLAPNVKASAKTEPDFDNLRDEEDFKKLLE